MNHGTSRAAPTAAALPAFPSPGQPQKAANTATRLRPSVPQPEREGFNPVPRSAAGIKKKKKRKRIKGEKTTSCF